jgi:catechol 2,3-dioxygenase-like lactoylglutathione lyase family enzyme
MMTRRTWIAGSAALLPRFVAAAPAFEPSKEMAEVTIVTNRLDRAKEFYGDICGFQKIAGPDTRFQLGDGALNILQPAKAAAENGDDPFKAVGIRGIALRHPNLDRFMKNIADHGRPAPELLGPGPQKLARLTDPDGNWIEMIFAGSEPKDLNHMVAILMVRDEAKSREFYGQTLGLADAPPHGKPETGLLYAYELGPFTILVRGIPKEFPVRTGPIEQSTGYRAITFSVKSANESAHALEARGVTIVKAPFNRSGGQRVFYAADPDGNYLEFVESFAANPVG